MCSCGWSAPDKARGVSGPALDPDRGRCAWLAGIERCNYPGAISHGTRGEGPWFCAQHFFCGDASSGGKIVAESRSWRTGEDVPRPYRQPAPMREPGADEGLAA